MKQLLILGGGASGMVAAIAAAEAAPPDTRILLLERNPRLGKKLLATGNGRCNLDNTGIRPACFFTADRQTMTEMLSAMGDPLDWFHRHGLLTRADEAGRVYPYSNQAADVLDLLLRWLETSGVEVRTDALVTGLDRQADRWSVTLEGGETLPADAVICAMGGSAGPQFGTDGSALPLLERLGCGSEPLYPCLVALRCRKSQVAGLSGIRAKADAALYDGSRLIHKESGEIQFTDYGLSGIAIMQLSGYLSPDSGIRKPEIRLDLFPHLRAEELTALLRGHSRALPTGSAGDFMIGLIHRKLGLAVWKAAGLGDGNRAVSSLKPEEWSALAHTFKSWSFTELENTGWKNAQTTGGGIALRQLEADTFMRKDAPGLYIVGESTDCAGSCGGFNLHWAFGSGILAGQAAARQLGGKGEPVRRQSAKPAAPNAKSSSVRKPAPAAKPIPRKPDKRIASASRQQGTSSRPAHGGKSSPKISGKAAPKSSRSRKGK